MDRVAFYGVVIASLYYADATINCGTCLQPPDYVSSFIKLKAQSAQSEAIILHNITEVPIKVDVQVKPISGNDTNFFFPGLGSSQQDDDKQGVYGGVVYKYNETAVKLYVPNRNDGSGDGSVIFTGYNNAWVGPKVQKEDAAEVRVRVWTACKFPTPDYESNWIPMKIKNGTDSFREVRHGLGYVPNYVTVQVWNNITDWYADGIASGMTPNSINKLTSWGGVVYAFDDNRVRIWVPGFDTGSMFSVADGWGQGSQETWSEGLVKVRVWGHMPGDTIYESNATIGQISRGNTSPRLGGVTGSLNMDAGLVSVTVKALSGDNNGFSFPALGAVQNTDPHDKFGGVVYSYSSHGIRVWHPIVPGAGNTSLYHKGTLIYVSPYWGGAIHSQDSKFGLIEVRFWNSYTGQCPPPTTPAQASTSPFTGTTSNSSGLLSTTSSPLTSVPVLTSTTAKSATALLTSAKFSTSTRRPTSHMQTTQASSSNSSQSSRTVGSVTLTSGAGVGGGSSTGFPVTASTGIRTTAGSNGSGTTTGSGVPGVTLATNSSPTRSTVMGRIQTADGGLSAVATGLIATASILSAAGCLGGLLFGFLKKKKKAKKQQRIDPEGEKTDAFGSQTVKDDNGGPSTDDGNSPTENENPKPDEGTHPPDDVSPPKDDGIPSVDNGTPDTANGSPPASTDRPQTARPD